jgi:hypothetical protein
MGDPNILHQSLIISKISKFGRKRSRERDTPRWVIEAFETLAVGIQFADHSHQSWLTLRDGLACLLMELRACENESKI